ncbi:MAG TPA: hypothetical protein VGY32_11495 [Solirubrobacteraceae bacterium]|jgi:hypothetical protein|nr:hypothetical protein [Solirubrobacteraceae bacterium]
MSINPGAMGAPLQIDTAGATPTPAQTVPGNVAGTGPQSTGSGILPAAKWLAAFVVMAGGLLLIADSPKYGDIAAALAAVIAVGAFTWQYQAVFQEIDKLFGTSLAPGFQA